MPASPTPLHIPFEITRMVCDAILAAESDGSTFGSQTSETLKCLRSINSTFETAANEILFSSHTVKFEYPVAADRTYDLARSGLGQYVRTLDLRLDQLLPEKMPKASHAAVVKYKADCAILAQACQQFRAQTVRIHLDHHHYGLASEDTYALSMVWVFIGTVQEILSSLSDLREVVICAPISASDQVYSMLAPVLDQCSTDILLDLRWTKHPGAKFYTGRNCFIIPTQGDEPPQPTTAMPIHLNQISKLHVDGAARPRYKKVNSVVAKLKIPHRLAVMELPSKTPVRLREAHLESLTFRDDGLSGLVSACPSLERLVLVNISAGNNDWAFLFNKISHSLALKTLSIAHSCCAATPNPMRSRKSVGRLEHLTLHNAHITCPDLMDLLIVNQRSLRRVELSDIRTHELGRVLLRSTWLQIFRDGLAKSPNLTWLKVGSLREFDHPSQPLIDLTQHLHDSNRVADYKNPYKFACVWFGLLAYKDEVTLHHLGSLARQVLSKPHGVVVDDGILSSALIQHAACLAAPEDVAAGKVAPLRQGFWMARSKKVNHGAGEDANVFIPLTPAMRPPVQGS